MKATLKIQALYYNVNKEELGQLHYRVACLIYSDKTWEWNRLRATQGKTESINQNTVSKMTALLPDCCAYLSSVIISEAAAVFPVPHFTSLSLSSI